MLASTQILVDIACTEWGEVCHMVLQVLRNKYDMGYLQPSWLGRKWQPWYQDLLDLAGIKGMFNLPFMLLPTVVNVETLVLAVQPCDNTNRNVESRRHVLLPFDARLHVILSACYVHVFLVHCLTSGPHADTYEVRNAAQGPHKGSKFVSTETGAPGVGRLRRRHRVQTMTHALTFLGLQSNDVQTRSPGGL